MQIGLSLDPTGQRRRAAVFEFCSRLLLLKG
jgi:hypothetical protein